MCGVKYLTIYNHYENDNINLNTASCDINSVGCRRKDIHSFHYIKFSTYP